MRSFDFKKLLPHLLITIGFAVLALIYCYPVLEGKVLAQSDIVSWKGMAHEAQTWFERTGENTLWTNSMFGGMPTYTFFVPKSHNYTFIIQEVITKVLAKPVGFLFIAMLSFYVLMCTLKVNRWLGVVGAIAFSFSTFFPISIAVGHDTKVLCMAYMPLALAGMLTIYRGRYLGGAALLGITMALMVANGHYQIIYYEMIIMVCAGIALFVEAIKNGKLSQFFIATAVTAVVGILSVGPSAANVFATKEYVKETMRGGQSELTLNHGPVAKKSGGLDRDYAFQWSNGVGETFCMMIPYLYGGSDAEDASKAPKTAELTGQDEGLPLYWGAQPFLSGPVYFGAIICFLFVLGVMVVRSPQKWWIVAASLIGIMLSMGKNFPALNYFLFDHLPMYNNFRTPTMALAIPMVLFPMLAIWGLMEILKGEMSKDEMIKKLKIATGITAGICVLLAVAGGMFFDYTGGADANYPPQLIKALKEDRSSLAMKSGLQSAMFILIAAGLIWAFITNKIKSNVLIGGIGLLIAVDLIPTASNYLGGKNYSEETDYDAAFQPRPVDLQIMQDKDPYYRVMDLSRNTYNDAIQCYFHKAIGGYSPAKLEIYQDLIDVHMSKKMNAQVLNMLNMKYLIFQTPDKQVVAQPNPNALGNAWFVSDVKWAKTADEEMLSMDAESLGDTATVPNAFNPRNTAIVRETFRNELNGYTFGKDSSAKVALTKYGLNELSFASHNAQNGLAVFSDIYYPHGWKAFIDGKETPIIRANYVLRAIKIPAGDHTIEFRFHPDSYYNGDKLALISSILLLGLAAAAIVMVFKGKGNDDDKNSQHTLRPEKVSSGI